MTQRNALPEGQDFAWGFTETLTRDEGGGDHEVPGVIDLGDGEWALNYRLRADDGGVTLHDGRLDPTTLGPGETIEDYIATHIAEAQAWAFEKIQERLEKDAEKALRKEGQRARVQAARERRHRPDLEIEP